MHDWGKVQQALLQKERELAQLMVRYARGTASADDLQALNEQVRALGERLDAMLKRAREGCQSGSTRELGQS